MKQPIQFGILGICLLLFAGCAERAPRWTNSSPEIDVVKNLVKDYQEGNWASWVSHYSDTAKVYHNSIEPTNTEDLLEGLQDYLEPVSEYRFSERDIYYEMIIDDKDQKWVNFWGTWEGTIAALDTQLVIPVHLTLQFVDGKIVEEHGFYNMAEYTVLMQRLEMMNEAESDAEAD